MSQYFRVEVNLDGRINFHYFGFTSHVYAFVRGALSERDACITAKSYFEAKYEIPVSKTLASRVKEAGVIQDYDIIIIKEYENGTSRVGFSKV